MFIFIHYEKEFISNHQFQNKYIIFSEIKKFIKQEIIYYDLYMIS